MTSRAEILAEFVQILNDPKSNPADIDKNDQLKTVLELPVRDAKEYSDLLKGVAIVYGDNLWPRIFSTVLRLSNDDLKRAVDKFFVQYYDFVSPFQQGSDDAEDVRLQLHDELYEQLKSSSLSDRRETLLTWINTVFPIYLWGEAQQKSSTQEDASNSEPQDRVDRLKKWIQTVGAQKLIDTEETRKNLDIFRTMSVTNPETYIMWFEALISLSSDLLAKTITYYKFGNRGLPEENAQIISYLLLCFKPAFINEVKHQAFVLLIRQLGDRSYEAGNKLKQLKDFARVNIPQAIFTDQTFNIGASANQSDDEDRPNRSKKRASREEEDTRRNKKGKGQDFAFQEPTAPTSTNDPIQEEPPSFAAEPEEPEEPISQQSIPTPSAQPEVPKKKQTRKPKTATATAKKKEPKEAKKEKKSREKIDRSKIETITGAVDWMQWFEIPLNTSETEPSLGLEAAIKKAKEDQIFKIIRSDQIKSGERFFGRRLILKTEFYKQVPDTLDKEMVLRTASFGVHECTEALPKTEIKNLRTLVWKDNHRFWNIR